LHICWAAQAALYQHYGIPKHLLPKKLSGIFEHEILQPLHPLMRGLNDSYLVPHSRYTTICRKDVADHPKLLLLGFSELAGVHALADKNGRNVYLTGHSEYDRESLAKEYFRDIKKGLDIAPPENYFPNEDVTRTPRLCWRATATLLFSNWLNYHVYQRTPYDLSQLSLEASWL
jgi:homoserine O-succinyltransferase